MSVWDKRMTVCGKENTMWILSRSPGKEGLISRLRVYSIFLLPSNCRSVLYLKYRVCLRTSSTLAVRSLQGLYGACLHIDGLTIVDGCLRLEGAQPETILCRQARAKKEKVTVCI